MERTELRLEILKLVHAHGREPGLIVERARALENYVMAAETPPTEKIDGRKKKMLNNADKPGAN